MEDSKVVISDNQTYISRHKFHKKINEIQPVENDVYVIVKLHSGEIIQGMASHFYWHDNPYDKYDEIKYWRRMTEKELLTLDLMNM